MRVVYTPYLQVVARNVVEIRSLAVPRWSRSVNSSDLWGNMGQNHGAAGHGAWPCDCRALCGVRLGLPRLRRSVVLANTAQRARHKSSSRMFNCPCISAISARKRRASTG